MKIREQALQQLKDFSENFLSNYARDRNFDFGPDKRTNTSCLSKYITHRIIDEEEVIKSANSKYPYIKIEKFIQEVFWRTYWKGWLELKPAVFQSYKSDLVKLNEQKQSKSYQDAIDGKTEIECFNDWVNELKQSGYLHNHARMWFASIWIFTLKLPWQLGADFFLKHLLDGDVASNTLSWRWVAGLHTKGKHYVAASWNINKFSGKKYDHLKLNEQKQSKSYLDAITGKTEIECFNDWVNELKQSGYLHNHARMWFASIWIFTHKLPWQLGADFFLKYLLDGDVASNTLSRSEERRVGKD